MVIFMPETVRFLHFSDLHIAFHPPKGDRLGTLLAEYFHPLEMLCGALRAQREWRPDFLLFTGDIAHYGETEAYIALRCLLKKEMPAVPAVFLPGNHDDRAAFCREILEQPPRERIDQVCDLAGVRIAALDTGADGVISPDQTEWLARAAAGGVPHGTLLAMHHPLYRQSPMAPASFPEDFPGRIAALPVAGILCGHTHENYVGSFAGKPYVTADAMSFTIRTKGGRMFCRLRAGYVRGEIGAHGLSVQIKRAASPADGAVRFMI